MARPHEHADERTGPGAAGAVRGRRLSAPVAAGDRVPAPGRDGGRTHLILPVAGKPAPAGEADTDAPARELAAALEGDVRFDVGHRAAYAREVSDLQAGAEPGRPGRRSVPVHAAPRRARGSPQG